MTDIRKLIDEIADTQALNSSHLAFVVDGFARGWQE
jgi:hypothetical protein